MTYPPKAMNWDPTVYSISYAHDDVIKWRHFPRYWPFVWGIHWSPVNSPHKDQWRGAFFDLRLNKQLSKQWRPRWYGTLSRSFSHHCNDILLFCLLRCRYTTCINAFEAKLKCLTFCRWHFQMHFLEWKFFQFYIKFHWNMLLGV